MNGKRITASARRAEATQAGFATRAVSPFPTAIPTNAHIRTREKGASLSRHNINNPIIVATAIMIPAQISEGMFQPPHPILNKTWEAFAIVATEIQPK
jgi:hypothetical protein